MTDGTHGFHISAFGWGFDFELRARASIEPWCWHERQAAGHVCRLGRLYVVAGPLRLAQ